MKVLKQTESELIIGERGITTRHWGILMFVLSGGGFIAVTVAGNGLPPGPAIGMITASVMGVFSAVFMGKVLTHRIDKITGIVRVEYPELLNTKLSVEEFKIGDIRSIERCRQNGFQQMLTNTSDIPGGKSGYAANGFSYNLKSGEKIESGIYSSILEEMELVIRTLSEFLDVPVD